MRVDAFLSLTALFLPTLTLQIGGQLKNIYSIKHAQTFASPLVGNSTV